MNHEESRLQQQCVAWFRSEYPQYAILLTHPINEGSKNTRVTGAIHKAEGTVAGVSDLLFFMSAKYSKLDLDQQVEWIITYLGLGIEFKTSKGRQSKEQKDFQQMFEAAGYKYIVIRSREEFEKEINDYISHANKWTLNHVAETYNQIIKARELKEKEHFYKVIGKK